jgi:hypothetical protein
MDTNILLVIVLVIVAALVAAGVATFFVAGTMRRKYATE